MQFEAIEFLGGVARFSRNGVSEYINSGRNNRVHASSVLRMGEHRLALRMRYAGRGLGDACIHIRDRRGGRFVSVARVGEDLRVEVEP